MAEWVEKICPTAHFISAMLYRFQSKPFTKRKTNSVDSITNKAKFMDKIQKLNANEILDKLSENSNNTKLVSKKFFFKFYFYHF